jgi:hypothetical protein
MRLTLVRPVCAIAALTAVCGMAPVRAQRWQMQYFYDEEKSTLAIVDLQFPSAKRGIAVGFIEEARKREPTSLVTSDGGAHWQRIALKEMPISLYFQSDSLGWMVTNKGLWRTTEAGKNWEKVGKPPSDILRVYFKDENTGWAVGPKKTVLETHDGGKEWTKVDAAGEEPGNPLYSAYTWVSFATPQFGLITGYNLPPRRFGPDFPDWLDPEGTLNQRDTPHLNYTLVTRDGGKSWHPTSASLFGETTKVRFLQNGVGLGLVEYSQMFHYPSEAYKLDWHTGKNETVYKDTKFSVTDIWLTSDGTAYLSGTQTPGKIRNVLPGKVQVLMSKDYSTWTEMPVDYRATANRTMIAGASDHDLWMATDAGMILHMVEK